MGNILPSRYKYDFVAPWRKFSFEGNQKHSDMELSYPGKSYKLIVLSSDRFNSAKNLTDRGSKYIIDCRTVKPDDIVNNLKPFCELIQEPQVSFVWLNCVLGKFLEIKGRLRKNLAENNHISRATSDLVIFKLTTHTHEVSEEEALKVSCDVLNFGKNLLDIHRLMNAHPGLLHGKFHLKQSLKRKRTDQPDEHGVAATSYSDNRRPRKAVFKVLQQMTSKSPNDVGGKSKCYMCNTTTLATLCHQCHKLNAEMKRESSDLRGRYAIVTGGRIKIGFETTLRLLRDGAFVIATTRFPVDAVKRFAKESDFHVWKNRLRIIYVDLQNKRSIEELLQFVEHNIPHLDILINNAAQTISKPQEYYQPMITAELNQLPSLPNDASNLLVNTNLDKLEQSFQLSSEPAITWPAHLDEFPDGQKDDHGEQLDLRLRNSWTYNLDEVPLQELLQVLTINAVGPFILTAKLKPLLKRSPFPRKFVVNVSAMEGQFSRVTKGHRHPHTNMAKAALNMMTRTSGLEFQMDGIYMTAVDTGWVTDERPFRQARHEADVKGFSTPLDCQDGAARVYHPIVHGLKDDNTPYFAIFLKNFKPHEW